METNRNKAGAVSCRLNWGNDYVDISADSHEELVRMANAEIEKRGIAQVDAWTSNYKEHNE